MKKLACLTVLAGLVAIALIFGCGNAKHKDLNSFALDDDSAMWFCNSVCNKIYDCALENLAVGKWGTFTDCVIFCDNAGAAESAIGACLAECDDNAECAEYDPCARSCLIGS